MVIVKFLRFKTHLKKRHNIEYDETKHGYVEKDPNIRKILETVFKISTQKPSKKAGSTQKPSKKADSTQIDVQFGDEVGNSFLNSTAPQPYHDDYVNY
jgi:hypothetical protein